MNSGLTLWLYLAENPLLFMLAVVITAIIVAAKP